MRNGRQGGRGNSPLRPTQTSITGSAASPPNPDPKLRPSRPTGAKNSSTVAQPVVANRIFSWGTSSRTCRPLAGPGRVSFSGGPTMNSKSFYDVLVTSSPRPMPYGTSRPRRGRGPMGPPSRCDTWSGTPMPPDIKAINTPGSDGTNSPSGPPTTAIGTSERDSEALTISQLNELEQLLIRAVSDMSGSRPTLWTRLRVAWCRLQIQLLVSSACLSRPDSGTT